MAISSSTPEARPAEQPTCKKPMLVGPTLNLWDVPTSQAAPGCPNRSLCQGSWRCDPYADRTRLPACCLASGRAWSRMVTPNWRRFFTPLETKMEQHKHRITREDFAKWHGIAHLYTFMSILFFLQFSFRSSPRNQQ